MTPLVVIVGPPGAGKTTVGELLAQRHGVGFRDTDRDVEATTGRAISDIFVESGEASFRRLEREAVKVALETHEGVLALGGGAVLDEVTRRALEGHRVVFLDVGLAAAVDRVGLNRSRPLLALNPRAALAKMLDERRPLYESVATVVIGTDEQAPEQVVEAITDELAMT